jgi:hypothetical protein
VFARLPKQTTPDVLERATWSEHPADIAFREVGSQALPAPQGSFLRGKFAIETFIHWENVALFKKGLAESRAPTRSETYS